MNQVDNAYTVTTLDIAKALHVEHTQVMETLERMLTLGIYNQDWLTAVIGEEAFVLDVRGAVDVMAQMDLTLQQEDDRNTYINILVRGIE